MINDVLETSWRLLLVLDANHSFAAPLLSSCDGYHDVSLPYCQMSPLLWHDDSS